MFTKVNQLILHSMLIVTPCVLAGNDDTGQGKAPAKKRLDDMVNESVRLANRNPWGSGKYAEKNPLDSYCSTIYSGAHASDKLIGCRPPGALFGAIVDLVKFPVVALRGELAEAEAQRLKYNATLLSELTLEGPHDQRNIEKLHKYYTDKTEFKGLTRNLLMECMVEQAKKPIPDNGGLDKIDTIDFKSDNFKRELRDKLKNHR